MRVLVIGGSRGTGRETVRALVETGHVPMVLARSQYRAQISGVLPADWISADARDAVAVRAAVAGADAIILTLGIGNAELFAPVTLFSQATHVVLDAMRRLGETRLIVLTGFGAGRSRDRIPVWQRLPFDCLFGRAYRDKDEQESLVVASGFDWTIVRPGVLTNGPHSGRYKVLADPRTWRNGVISRKDVAAFLVSQLSDSTFIRRDVGLVG